MWAFYWENRVVINGFDEQTVPGVQCPSTDHGHLLMGVEGGDGAEGWGAVQFVVDCSGWQWTAVDVEVCLGVRPAASSTVTCGTRALRATPMTPPMPQPWHADLPQRQLPPGADGGV